MSGPDASGPHPVSQLGVTGHTLQLLFPPTTILQTVIQPPIRLSVRPRVRNAAISTGITFSPGSIPAMPKVSLVRNRRASNGTNKSIDSPPPVRGMGI